MALELVVDSLDAVPEAVRSLYVEQDGKFSLAVNGLPDTKGLKSALEAEREAAKVAKKAAADLAKKYEGIDPEKTRAMLARFDNDIEAKLMAEGKVEDVIARRTERLRQEMEKQLEGEAAKVAQANERAAKYEQKVLDNAILAAVTKVGIHKSAIEDALLRGRNLFRLSEDGSAVQLGSDGKPVYGKDGKTLFGPDEWLEGSKEWAPHWHPAGNSGGGASGGGSNSGAKTMTRAQFEKQTSASRQAFLRDGGKVTD